jgi:CheY-like chemotaxis protein
VKEVSLLELQDKPMTSLEKTGHLAGTVLVVDNDPVVKELMVRSLTREGFHVATAANGAEGLRLAQQLRPAAIILDIVMPGGPSGWEVLTALKADPELAAIPVIMATMVDERSKGFALGVTDYLIKPVERARLAAILRKCQMKNAPCSVLIVEDDPANREILTRLVVREGWSAVEAVDGRAAMECVARTPPDLILLDLKMPVLDGLGFVRELQKTPACRSIPIVAITAKELTEDDRRQLSGCVQKILQKGAYSRDELLRETRRLMATQVQSRTVRG